MAREGVSAMVGKIAAKCAGAGVVGALALVGMVGLGASPARAGDDGAAPIWVGVGSIFGPLFGVKNDDSVIIDYHERGKLVLPPKADLPPPIPRPRRPSPPGRSTPKSCATEKRKLKKRSPALRLSSGETWA